MLQNRALLGATLSGAGRYTPSFVGANSTDGTNISLPAGAQPGDFALLFGSTPDLLSGWTQSYNQTGTLPFFEAHYRFLPDPVPSSYTFTNMRLGILMVFRNVDNSTPLDVAAPPLATTSTPPTITTLNERCTLVVGHETPGGRQGSCTMWIEDHTASLRSGPVATAGSTDGRMCTWPPRSTT